ncbi:MAG TPA: alpha-amylase family glycosyl hydrolase [Candidatus Limnocylindria bacterium]|nr:alpha-amylase family glycosyl hydrolase [Candidatus Limnocylindria bacterium]
MPGEWWREGVFYQIYPRSFQDSNGDGVGDLNGITARLDHLNDGTPVSLGVDAIWLSPFYRSPMADFGYDVSDYRDVDPAFGTLADFDRLLAEAHRRGIHVIVDLVPGHTSDRHPWFESARSSRRDPKRDFYVWADPRRGGGSPNNWRSAFPRVGGAWTFDRGTGQYYLHHFLPEQPDLNWWNEEVRAAIDDVLRFWLDRGVDGFRVDVAHGLVRDRALRDNPRMQLFGRPRRRNWDLDEVHEIHRRWRGILDSYEGDRMAVGEVGVRDLARLVRYHGQDDELQLAFNFRFLDQPSWSAEAFRAEVERWERLLPATAWPDYTLSNHDRHRAASRFGLGRPGVAATMLLTLRGTPFLYYGEEIGMVDGTIPAERVVDVDGRDPERTPMQWDASPNAGFSSAEPWLPVAAGHEKRNVAAQRDDPDSLFSLYRRLIGTRKGSRALRRGSYRTVPSPRGVFAYVREADGERVFVALNFTKAHHRVSFGAAEGRVLLSTDRARDGEEVGLQRVALAPDEGLILTRR